MHSYTTDSHTTLALDWLTGHPTPEAVTRDPDRWARETGEAMFQRIHELVDTMASPVTGEEYLARLGRLNSAWQMATEVAMGEYLPSYPTPDDHEGWVPLMPEIADLL